MMVYLYVPIIFVAGVLAELGRRCPLLPIARKRAGEDFPDTPPSQF